MDSALIYKIYFEPLIKKYGVIFCLAYFLVFITYSYFFTTIIFTNHTFPNTLVNQYPSFTTFGEGRWFGDIIRVIVGTSGVQSFQMFIGVGIQIINAFLFIEILRINNRAFIFSVAAFLSLHPVFLDYYSFNIDHISYTFGDSLALIGVLFLSRNKSNWKNTLISALVFTLCIATYQPKLAFIVLLVIIYLIHEILFNVEFGISIIIRVVVAILLSVILYYITSLYVLMIFNSDRNHINSLQEITMQIFNSYYEFGNYFIKKASYLPSFFKYLPISCILLGACVLLKKGFKKNIYHILFLIFLIILIPISLRTSYIINKNTWNDAGRILAPYAYCLIYFISMFYNFSGPVFKKMAIIILAIFIYFFVIIGIQETNYANLKSIYEQNKINRIITRIENEVPDLYQKQYGLLVIGDIYMDHKTLMNTPIDYNNAHIVKSNVFANYRQVEILNYFLGENIFALISKEERDSIIKNISEREAWPSKESVFIYESKTVVVLLKKYASNEETTVTK